jgi:hypothetical protein
MLIVGILALTILVLRHTVWLPKAVREVQTEGIDVSEMDYVAHDENSDNQINAK